MYRVLVPRAGPEKKILRKIIIIIIIQREKEEDDLQKKENTLVRARLRKEVAKGLLSFFPLLKSNFGKECLLVTER